MLEQKMLSNRQSYSNPHCEQLFWDDLNASSFPPWTTARSQSSRFECQHGVDFGTVNDLEESVSMKNNFSESISLLTMTAQSQAPCYEEQGGVKLPAIWRTEFAKNELLSF